MKYRLKITNHNEPPRLTKTPLNLRIKERLKRLFSFIPSFKKTIHHEFRSDIQMWEKAIKIAGLISVYRYTIRTRATLKIKYRLLKYQKSACEYVYFKPLSLIKIGKKEFQEKYNGNKWIVPVNYELDLTRD